MAGTAQQHICQHGYAKGLLHPSLLPTPLVCPQSQVGLAFPIDWLHGPSALVCTDALSRDPLVQSGPQDFCRCRAQGTPSFPPHHGDVAEVPQTQACALPPEGFPACRSREAGHADALRREARPMRPQVCERFPRDRFPCPGHGTPNTPAPSGLIRIALQDHRPMRLGARRGSALHDHPLGPGGRDNALHPRTAQGLFGGRLWRACGPNAPQSSGQAIPVPVGQHQDKAHPDTPGMLRTFTPFLGQRIVGLPLGLLTAIPHQRERPILGRRQRLQGFLGPPCHPQRETPRARLHQAAASPRGARGWGPTRKFCQGLLSRDESLHAHPPTQEMPVTTVPDARHPAPEQRDTQGQRGDENPSRPRRVKGGSNPARGILAVLFSHMLLAVLLCKASWVWGVVSENKDDWSFPAPPEEPKVREVGNSTVKRKTCILYSTTKKEIHTPLLLAMNHSG